MAKQSGNTKIAGTGKLLCRVITPRKNIFARRVASVELDTAAGRLEVFPRYEPTIAPLKVGGIMRAHEEDGSETPIAVHGGFMDMNGNTLVILADSAELGSEIDTERARLALARAKEMLAEVTEDDASKVKVDTDRAKLAVMRALARLKAAGESAPPGAL